ncbi:IclR family transcriptional regulator [Phycicoccus sp. CSK15P-2]|uniref:IclR family transcriptional regulator n=1 Tax=Phycicoccus sp. CSK15P-2 TaxID=2807627 RepID=UPI001950F8EA|nr:IclR family transcriptional regulator [Phycicoccus sp. CSK15P-2]MBM6402689.1 IclR family transcriptional regulator [Phycicoccus sp. CSK15P-2]
MDDDGRSARADGVQALHRALDVLETVARHGGQLSVGEIAAASGLPVPTTHRLLRTLVSRGYMRQAPDRRYALGSRLVPLGTAAGSLAGAGSEAVLARLVDALGETANLATLSGAHAQYVAQAPGRHTMRMFTEVGRQVDLHSTGVGKAMLARMPDDRALELVRRVGLTPRTVHTLVTEDALLADLELVRRRGYAVDDQEQEIGVRCVAVALGDPLPWLALSVSGPVTRMTDELVERAVPLILGAAAALGEGHHTGG